MSSLRKAGTHTLCPIDQLRRMGAGSITAFTRIFDALRAGTISISASSQYMWLPERR
jgi:hypothetical protein